MNDAIIVPATPVFELQAKVLLNDGFGVPTPTEPAQLSHARLMPAADATVAARASMTPAIRITFFMS